MFGRTLSAATGGKRQERFYMGGFLDFLFLFFSFALFSPHHQPRRRLQVPHTMARRPTIISTPAGSLLLALFRLAVLFVSPVAPSFTNDFSGYPSGAQACLYDAADQSGCQGDTSQAMNACLCGGGDGGSEFVTTAGACIGADDAGDLRSTWVCSHRRKISLGV